MIGNLAFRCSVDGVGVIAGFENHSGQTRLGGDAMPLGYVLHGFGNNGADGTEGVHQGNVFGTYSHGPVLPKNPSLCDFILLTALREKYGCAELCPLDNAEEQLAHDAAIKMMFR